MMDAMLLAAGLGTRLRPLTESMPKALVKIDGVPMLERVALRLIAAGADRLVINTHHFGEQIEEYVREREGWGVEVVLSREPGAPLETGGGLLHARDGFQGNATFFLHNTDILTDLPLAEMYAAHATAGEPLATLAVMQRETSRYLLFDDIGLLGRTDERKGLYLRVRERRGEVRKLGFGGVHVISPRIFDLITETGAFSILDPYLRLAEQGERILPFRIDEYEWIDIGKPEQLEAARATS